MLQSTYLETHVFQVAEYPGGNSVHAGCVDACNRTGVDQPAMSAVDIGLFPDMGGMAMAMTDQIIVARTSESLSVMRHMRDENLASSEFQHGLLSMIGKHTAGLCHHAVKRGDIAYIVAMNGMNWNAEPERSAQGIDADQVTAVDDSLRPRGLRLHNCFHKGVGAVMTVGNDTDLHTYFWRRVDCGTLSKIRAHSVYNHIGWGVL